MGSNPDNQAADVGSPSLILTRPTAAERLRTWASTHPQWGAALNLDDYLRREEYLLTVPVSKDGGITQWILTDSAHPPDERPILSSCESLQKRALVAQPDGTVKEAVAHGIASVFTDPAFRGKGYASKMMSLLGPQLGTWKGAKERTVKDDDKEVAFSVLFSDIGKTFYAKQGWHPYESTHLSFKPSKKTDTATSDEKNSAKPVGSQDITELCSIDEKLLRARLAKPSPNTKTRVMLIPDIDAIQWHLMREEFMTKHIFSKTPTVRGGVFGDAGRRVWAMWTRGYYGGLQNIEGNTLHILRLVIEDETTPDKELALAVGAIIRLAREQAAEWQVAHVEMWNPSERVRALVEKTGIEHELVDREKDSITSLMWYGKGEVEWVANEKFGWC